MAEAEDLSAFFGPEFAITAVRQRAGVPDAEVRVIYGLADEQSLQGYASLGQHAVHFDASTDLRAGDTLLLAGLAYRVIGSPQRVNDGREALAAIEPEVGP